MLPTDLITRLTDIVGADGVVHRDEDLLVYECDHYTLARKAPAAAVLPRNTQQAVDVTKALAEHNVPVVPRGSGTGIAGGTLPVDDAVMVCTTRMTRILDVDVRNRWALVEAGVINSHISDRVAEDGYHYAPDPASRSACTIGGNVATNAGGPHTLKYGVTTNHILGLTMVAPDGQVIRTGGPYQDMPGYDLTGILCGSEGTCGLVTEVYVRLTRNPQAYRTLLAVFESVGHATRTVSAIIAAGIIPAALELADTVMLANAQHVLDLDIAADAGVVLIIELDGPEEGLDLDFDRITDICNAQGVTDLHTAQSVHERQQLWKVREQMAGAMGRLSPDYCTQDAVVPRTRLPEIVDLVMAIGRKYDIKIINFFHAGDGNIHPHLLFDQRDEDLTRRVQAANDEIIKACVDVGGTITGEHGIGTDKVDKLPWMFNRDDLDVMLKLRDVFNPDGRFNGNKVFEDNQATDDTESTERKEVGAVS